MDSKTNNLWPEDLNPLSAEQQNTLHDKLLADFKQQLVEEKINPGTEILSRFRDLYLPLSSWLSEKHTDHPIVIGLNGAQGSGKSTLTKILATLLEKGFDKRVVTLSIDDLYKTRLQRQKMAETIHPLFLTRGVPGTHDTEFGLQILKTLKSTKGNNEVLLPRFNKATDDQYDKQNWKCVHTPVDIILFEGWCVGAIAEEEKALSTAINQLEAEEDQQSIWRHYVNKQLADPYQMLFSHIDILIMLEIPDMKHVYQWRVLQEQKLGASIVDANQHIMSNDQIERFIMHYERITCSTLKEMPSRADIVLKLNEAHQISKVKTRLTQ